MDALQETFKYFFCFSQKNIMKGDTSNLSALDIISIKSALSPSSTFIDDIDISCWRFGISDFNILFSIQYDWIVTLILSGDVREIGVFGFKGIVNEFAFRFIDLLFLCKSFFCFWLKPIYTKALVSIEHSFDW